ncbi:hypothetical protein [Dyadobacter sp. CY312]|uniref:hypothetical protein n=1 Tax=Dyadobacter sp. CY312 TaxID=2907303 RepID=UPI001F258B91|nr:hypothetical protein [Dyadobacter sp. CY312]MCE7040710.1 hypothetical protein [Dyadobacter sp. CY312]
MDRIVIEVGDNLARRWRNATPEVKQAVSQEVDQFLNTILEKNAEDVWPFLEELRAKAEQKGFSDEILEQILNEK